MTSKLKKFMSAPFSLLRLSHAGMWILGAQGVQFVTSMLTFSLLPRLLDEYWYGILTLLNASSVFLLCFDLGLKSSVRNTMTHINVTSGDRTAMSREISFVFMFLLLVGGALGVAVLSYKFYLQDIVRAADPQIQAVNWVIVVCGLLLILQLPLSLSEVIAPAIKRFAFYAQTQMARSFLTIGLVLSIFYSWKNPAAEVVILAFFGMNVLISLLILWVTLKSLKLQLVWIWKGFWTQIVQRIYMGRTFFIGSVAYAVVYYYDYFLIAKRLSVVSTGEYRILVTLFQTAVFFSHSFLSPYQTVFTEDFVKKDFLAIRSRIVKACLIIGFLAVCASVLAPWLGPYVLKFFTGRNFFEAQKQLFFISLTSSFQVIQYPFSLLCIAIGKPLYPAAILLVQGLVKLVVASYAIDAAGIDGVIYLNFSIAIIPFIGYFLAYNRFINTDLTVKTA